MGKIYTSQYRYSGPHRKDITAKSGDKLFAPAWNLVMAYKSGQITEDEYADAYRLQMEISRRTHPKDWEELLRQEHTVLVCFCRAGAFCHRVLLAKMLEELGAEYCGEVDCSVTIE